MMYLVITEKLTQEGKKNFKKVLEWQKRFDEWLISHGATWKSVKHFVTLIGEPVYETWLEYPNYSALDEDDEKTKEFAKNPESNNCRHVKFALNLPEVQEILQKKGWKIPE
jgi:hypothetical protein